jgi:hypothetical protein
MYNDKIGDPFVQAVDTVIGMRLSDIPRDNTLLCEVVDNTDREEGRYKVRYNDIITYEVTAESTSYLVGDLVYVLEPAVASANRTIISRYRENLDSLEKAYVELRE